MSEEKKMEDSMQGPEEEKGDTEIVPYQNQKGFDGVDSMLSQMINLDSNSVVHEPTCPLCSTPLRREAEELWEQNPRTTSEVTNLMKTRSNLKVNAEIVKNHMKNHRGGVEREIQKVEYVNRVRSLYGQSATTLERVELCMAVITERLMQINSITPSSDKSVAEIEKIKSDQTVKLMNSYNSILKLQATILGEMKDTGEMISIPRQTFIEIFNTAIADAKSDRERDIILGILNGLKGT